MTSLESIMKQNIAEVHTAIPGKIVKFDASRCIAEVQPTLSYHVADGRVLTYPVIVEVPVFMPKAGVSTITYPVKEGDSCLLVFSERSLDEWMGKSTDEHHDPRKFDLTDAFAFVGMCPAQNINPENIEVINGATTFEVTPNAHINVIGNISVVGRIDCTGDVTGGGISLINHTHPYHHGSTGPSQ